MTTDTVRVLGFSGSLRKGSYNSATLRAALDLCPPGVTLDTFDIAPIPLYNEDVYKKGFPEPVQRLREAIAAADAVLIVSPEYNFSMPGVLKNAIDWVSRPPSQPFDGKPVGIIGASPGMLGTARMQYHLRQTLVSLNALTVNKPEVMITRCSDKFDADGNLTDDKTREMITRLLTALRDWTGQVKG